VAPAKTANSPTQLTSRSPQSPGSNPAAGSQHPSLPGLAKILAALNLEMRITLTDYDTDDIISDPGARCPMTRDDEFDPVRVISYEEGGFDRNSPASLAFRSMSQSRCRSTSIRW
jgi:hypothetical protein